MRDAALLTWAIAATLAAGEILTPAGGDLANTSMAVPGAQAVPQQQAAPQAAPQQGPPNMEGFYRVGGLPPAAAAAPLSRDDIDAVSSAASFGILLELLGTFLNVIGKQCIRYAALTNNLQFWITGVVLWNVLYPLFDVVALDYAPESTVFSVDGMIVVWNILLAPYSLGEPVTNAKLASALVVTAGTLGAGAFGSKSDKAFNSAEYFAMLCSASALVYYTLFLTIVVTILLLLRGLDPRSRACGVLQGMLAGWIGGSAFLLKLLMELLREARWTTPALYVTMLLTVAYMAASVVVLSQALKRHEAVLIVPIFEGTLVFNGAINGYLVLRDWAGVSVWRSGLYWVSIVIILFGLYLICRWPSDLCGDGDAIVPWLSCCLRPPPGSHHLPSSSSSLPSSNGASPLRRQHAEPGGGGGGGGADGSGPALLTEKTPLVGSPDRGDGGGGEPRKRASRFWALTMGSSSSA